jgi:hypothetical protein
MFQDFFKKPLPFTLHFFRFHEHPDHFIRYLSAGAVEPVDCKSDHVCDKGSGHLPGICPNDEPLNNPA